MIIIKSFGKNNVWELFLQLIRLLENITIVGFADNPIE